jgi:hypothetical protein
MSPMNTTNIGNPMPRMDKKRGTEDSKNRKIKQK